ncbi:UNVERIFIED_CONTAM: hypothetical protein RMT77_007769 [Armadillidium vulgare]
MIEYAMKPSKSLVHEPKGLFNPLSKSGKVTSEFPRAENPDAGEVSPSVISGVNEIISTCPRNPSVIRKNTQSCFRDFDMVPFDRQDLEPLPKKRRLLDVRDQTSNSSIHDDFHKQSSVCQSSGDELESSVKENGKVTPEYFTSIKTDENSKLSDSSEIKSPLQEPGYTKLSENTSELKGLKEDLPHTVNGNSINGKNPDLNSDCSSQETSVPDVVPNDEKSPYHSKDSNLKVLNDFDESLPNNEDSFLPSRWSNPSPLSTISEKSNPDTPLKENAQTSESSTSVPKAEEIAVPNNNPSTLSSKDDVENSVEEFQDILAKACHAVGLDEGPMNISDVEDSNFAYPFPSYNISISSSSEYFPLENQEIRIPYNPSQARKEIIYQPRPPNPKIDKCHSSLPPVSHHTYPPTDNVSFYRGNPSSYPQRQPRYQFPNHRVPYHDQLPPHHLHNPNPSNFQYSPGYSPKASYSYSDSYPIYRHPNPVNYQQKSFSQFPSHPDNVYHWTDYNYKMHYYYRYPVRPPSMPPTHQIPYSDPMVNYKSCRFESLPYNVRQRLPYIPPNFKKQSEIPRIQQYPVRVSNNAYNGNANTTQPTKPSQTSTQEYSPVKRKEYSPITSPITPAPFMYNNSQPSQVPRVPTTVNSIYYNVNNNETHNNILTANVPTKHLNVFDPKTVPPTYKNLEHSSKTIESVGKVHSAYHLSNNEATSRGQGPFVIERVRQNSYPQYQYSDWKVPTYSSDSLNSKNNQNNVVNGISGYANRSDDTNNFTYNNGPPPYPSSQINSSATNSRSLNGKEEGLQTIKYHSQTYYGTEKIIQPPQLTESESKGGIERARKEVVNRRTSLQVPPGVNKKHSESKTIEETPHTQNTFLNSKHGSVIPNLSKAYPYSSPPEYENKYLNKHSSDQSGHYNSYSYKQENGHVNTYHNYNNHKPYVNASQQAQHISRTDTSKVINNNNNNNKNNNSTNSVVDPTNKRTSNFSVTRNSIGGQTGNSNSGYHDEFLYCAQKNICCPDKKPSIKDPGRNSQSNPGTECLSELPKESHPKDIKKRSLSLPSDITIGPFILNKGYATFTSENDDEREVLIFKQKLMPVIDHLLSIPEAANLRPLRNNPDELLDHLVKLWGGKGANSTALDCHQRMKENFASVVRFLFKPHLLALWGWDKAPPEQILDELLNTSEQGHFLAQMTLGEIYNLNASIHVEPTKLSSEEDDVFLPSSNFSCNDVSEDVFNYFGIIDTTSVPQSTLNGSTSERQSSVKTNSVSSEEKSSNLSSSESSLRNCSPKQLTNESEATEIPPNLSSVEDMIPFILDESVNSGNKTISKNPSARTYNFDADRKESYMMECDQRFSSSELPKKRGNEIYPIKSTVTTQKEERVSNRDVLATSISINERVSTSPIKQEYNSAEWDKLAEHLIECKKLFSFNEKHSLAVASNEEPKDDCKTVKQGVLYRGEFESEGNSVVNLCPKILLLDRLDNRNDENLREGNVQHNIKIEVDDVNEIKSERDEASVLGNKNQNDNAIYNNHNKECPNIPSIKQPFSPKKEDCTKLQQNEIKEMNDMVNEDMKDNLDCTKLQPNEIKEMNDMVNEDMKDNFSSDGKDNTCDEKDKVTETNDTKEDKEKHLSDKSSSISAFPSEDKGSIPNSEFNNKEKLDASQNQSSKGQNSGEETQNIKQPTELVNKQNDISSENQSKILNNTCSEKCDKISPVIKCNKDHLQMPKISSHKNGNLKLRSPVSDYTSIFKKYVESKLQLAKSQVSNSCKQEQDKDAESKKTT